MNKSHIFINNKQKQCVFFIIVKLLWNFYFNENMLLLCLAYHPLQAMYFICKTSWDKIVGLLQELINAWQLLSKKYYQQHTVGNLTSWVFMESPQYTGSILNLPALQSNHSIMNFLLLPVGRQCSLFMKRNT